MSRMIEVARSERGAAALEFALAAPVLFTIVIGVAQLGIMYSASTGVHHAVEEGARLAAVYPTPSNADIEARVLATKFMLGNADVDPDVTRGTTPEGDQYVDIKLSYSIPLNFIFFSTPPVTVGHSRRVFCQVDSFPAPTSSACSGGTGGGSTGTGTGGTGTGTGTGGGTGTGTGDTTGGGTGDTTGGTGKDKLPKSNGNGGKK